MNALVRSRWVRMLAWMWASSLRLQGASWRAHMLGLDRLDDRLLRGDRTMVVFWHGKYVPLSTLLRGRRVGVLTSRSFRGDILAELSRHFGYRGVQLADHGGAASREAMRQAVRRFGTVGIAVDGPLGPYHDVKRGTLRVAAQLGADLLPVTVAAHRKKIVTTRWDRMELPRPFTRMCLMVGEPLRVPRDIDPNGIERWGRRVRRRLEALDREAESRVARNVGRTRSALPWFHGSR